DPTRAARRGRGRQWLRAPGPSRLRREPHRAPSGAGTRRTLAEQPPGVGRTAPAGRLPGVGDGILPLGAVDGAFTQAMLDAGDDMPPAFAEVFGTQGLLDGYAAFLGSFVSVLVAGYAVYALQTLREEESRGRAETVLSTPVGRAAWLGSHALVVACGV